MVTLRLIRFQNSKVATLSAIAIVIVMIMSSRFTVQAQFTEYERFVHEYVNSGTGENATYLDKPVFPVLLHDFQVPIGENWSIVAPLIANHFYHVYCYGKWVDNGSTPKTDYDIYVYNSLGELEGYHTEAAGLPEHLGNTVDDAFFAPKYSSNYTFVVRNDPRESHGSQGATFMIIEDVECNQWHQRYVEGKDNNDLPVLNTSWSYEFTTESRRVEVYVKVPGTLDMYEARLYLMYDPSDPNRTILNGVPLAWEPGLYGNLSDKNNLVGGYNLESKEYRGVAYASCEFYGQEMFFNYTSPFAGKNLYHLVFIGEKGFGTIDFLVKTDFGNTTLLPVTIPGRVYPNDNVTTIVYASNSTDLTNATLEYSVDSWTSVNTTSMEISSNSCRATIPGQEAGTIVHYRVNASDVLENELTVNGSYSVKYDAVLNFSQLSISSRLGDNVTISGSFSPQFAGVPISVYVSSGNETKEIDCLTLGNGSFEVDFRLETVGEWAVDASFNGSSSIYACEGPLVTVRVEETFLAKYQYYIFGALGGVIATGMAVYIRKSKA